MRAIDDILNVVIEDLQVTAGQVAILVGTREVGAEPGAAMANTILNSIAGDIQSLGLVTQRICGTVNQGTQELIMATTTGIQGQPQQPPQPIPRRWGDTQQIPVGTHAQVMDTQNQATQFVAGVPRFRHSPGLGTPLNSLYMGHPCGATWSQTGRKLVANWSLVGPGSV